MSRASGPETPDAGRFMDPGFTLRFGRDEDRGWGAAGYRPVTWLTV